jgi:hypothetical protein
LSSKKFVNKIDADAVFASCVSQLFNIMCFVVGFWLSRDNLRKIRLFGSRFWIKFGFSSKILIEIKKKGREKTQKTKKKVS